jgi:hypothetical protein
MDVEASRAAGAAPSLGRERERSFVIASAIARQGGELAKAK